MRESLIAGCHGTPGVEILLVFGTVEIAVVLAIAQTNPIHPGGQIAANRVLEQLRHGQPGLDVFLRFVFEDVLAAFGTEMVFLALVVAFALRQSCGIIRLGEHDGQLAGLTELGQTIVGKRRTGRLEFLDVVPTWAVVLVEGTGRKNWLFAGSLRAGKRAAAIMSLIQSAKLNGHDPFLYLKDILSRLPTQPNSKIDELLPHRWQPEISA